MSAPYVVLARRRPRSACPRRLAAAAHVGMLEAVGYQRVQATDPHVVEHTAQHHGAVALKGVPHRLRVHLAAAIRQRGPLAVDVARHIHVVREARRTRLFSTQESFDV